MKNIHQIFSVILAVINPKRVRLFGFVAINGMPKRPHNNKIEKQKIYGYPHSTLLQSVIKKEVMMRKLTQKKQTGIIILKVRYSVLYKMRTLNYLYNWN